MKFRQRTLAVPFCMALLVSACDIDLSNVLNDINSAGTVNSDDPAETPIDMGTADPVDDSAVDLTADSTAGIYCDYVDVTYNNSASVQDTSTSTWSCSATDRELVANGLPDHEVGEFPNPGNPNTIAAQDISASITLSPVATDTATGLGGPAGVTGYVLNGVKIDAGTGGSCVETASELSDCDLGDNTGQWNIEAVSQDVFDFGTDENNAHVQPGGTYHYHGLPENFITKQGGDSTSMTLIGWAADGFPIYARYGYSVADDASSEIRAMQGSYQHLAIANENRPSTDTFPMGAFAQDWEYVEGSGDLDECNGRVGVTPEFPNGIYHYYGTDSYPFLQRCVKGEVEGGGGPPGGPDGAGGPGGPGGPEGGVPPEGEGVPEGDAPLEGEGAPEGGVPPEGEGVPEGDAPLEGEGPPEGEAPPEGAANPSEVAEEPAV